MLQRLSKARSAASDLARADVARDLKRPVNAKAAAATAVAACSARVAADCGVVGDAVAEDHAAALLTLHRVPAPLELAAADAVDNTAVVAAADVVLRCLPAVEARPVKGGGGDKPRSLRRLVPWPINIDEDLQTLAGA